MVAAFRFVRPRAEPVVSLRASPTQTAKLPLLQRTEGGVNIEAHSRLLFRSRRECFDVVLPAPLERTLVEPINDQSSRCFLKPVVPRGQGEMPASRTERLTR